MVALRVLLSAIAWYDNIPLLSYWLLRGRCRHCGATFSIRYFLIELGTALGFVGLFVLEIIANVHDLPFFNVNHGTSWPVACRGKRGCSSATMRFCSAC